MKPLVRFLVPVVLALVASSASAQFSGNNQTNTINTATNWVGNYIVGSNTTFDVLRVVNGGVLTNASGYIGYTVAGSDNLAVVDGSGGAATWINSGSLVVGNSSVGNSLNITRGGAVINANGVIGLNSNFNQVTVGGSGSVWTNTGTLIVGSSAMASGNQLLVTNGGAVFSTGVSVLGNSVGANGNSVTVSGSGSIWTNAGQVSVGKSGSFNQLILTNAGTFLGANCSIGDSGGANSNVVIVTGSGTTWSNSTITVGNSASFNQLLISDGARVISGGAGAGSSMIGNNAAAVSNLVVVTDDNTLWTNGGTTFYLGSGGAGNRLVVSNGATVVVPNVYMAGNASSVGNNILVSDDGSTLRTSAFYTRVGAFNTMVVSNGGTFAAASSTISWAAGSTGNVAIVTGEGSTWTNSGNMAVGSAGFSNALLVSAGGRVFATTLLVGGAAAGSNRVEITSGGLVEATTLTVNAPAGNTISNDGGIFQFSTAAPTITPNGYGRISLTDGTISFRGVTNVNVKGNWGVGALGRVLTNIAFVGDNAFRLDNSSLTNAGQDYVFATGSATNYSRLEMINGATLWQGGSLTVGATGSMLASNTAATIAGAFTNLGSVSVVNSTLSFSQPMVMSGAGSFTLRNATNAFSGGLVISSNTVYGGSGFVSSGAGATNFGTISPGNSPGTLTFSSNLALLGSSVVVMELAGTNSSDYDHLVVGGVLALGGALTVTNLGMTFTAGDTFDLFDFASLSGAFSVTNLPTLSGGLEWDFGQFESDGILSIGIPIPEPSTGMVLGLAAVAATLARTLRRRGKGNC